MQYSVVHFLADRGSARASKGQSYETFYDRILRIFVIS